MILDPGFVSPRGKGRLEDGKIELGKLRDYYLEWMEKYGGEQWMSLLFETPETPRMVSRVGASPVYRATVAKLLATMLLTLRGTPILYQGEELGLANTRFASADELRDRVSLHLYNELRDGAEDTEAFQKVLASAAEHAQVPMPWGAGPSAGFTGAKPWIRMPDGAEYLNATAQMEDARSVWSHYHALIALRKKSQGLTYGSLNPVFKRNKKLFCYFRIYDGEKWYVEMNLTEKEVSRSGHILRTQRLVLSNYDTPAKTLRPYEANVYKCE